LRSIGYRNYKMGLQVNRPDDPAPSRTPVRTKQSVVGGLAAVAGAVVIYILTSLSMLLTRSDWSWSSFRSFGSGDQLSYLAYVVNVAGGRLNALEPFTETGTSSFPRDYYVGLGIVARIFGLSPEVAWSVCGVLVQVVLVVTLAIVCIKVSGKNWTGLLAVVPFVIGVMSVVSGGDFFRPMNSHAVLWGPFAVLFPLNGEAFGLSVGAFCLLALGYAALRLQPGRLRVAIAVAASAIIGSLANVQTYSFLAVVYLTVFPIATYALVTQRKRWPVILSIGLIPVLFLIGPHLPFRGSQLVTLMLGLLPALPGLLLLARRTRGLVIVLAAAALLTASPSIVSVAVGLYHHDPFLIYRVASSKDLGVWWWAGIVGSLAVTVPLTFLFIAGLRKKRPLWLAFSVGVVIPWALLSSNDVWGANQEPYRLWIDCFMLIAVSSMPFLLAAARVYLSHSSIDPDTSPPLTEGVASLAPSSRRQGWIAGVAIGVVGITMLVSTFDWGAFYIAMHKTSLISLHGSRQSALAEASKEAKGGLVLPDACIDPLTLKAIIDKPIAFMNVGMAWPKAYTQLIDVNILRGQGILDVANARSGGVHWILTDSACKFNWGTKYVSNLTKVSGAAYDKGLISLWSLRP
jgi:hypothetical protein